MIIQEDLMKSYTSMVACHEIQYSIIMHQIICHSIKIRISKILTFNVTLVVTFTEVVDLWKQVLNAL